MLSLIITALALITFLYVILIKWKHRYWKRKGVPQLNPTIVFGDFGPVFSASTSYKDFFLNIYKSARSAGHKYVGVYAMAKAQFVPIDIELIKRIVSKDFHYFTSRGAIHHKSIHLTANLLSMEGKEWKDRRVKLTPLFTSGKIRTMFETVCATANNLVETVGDLADYNKVIQSKDVFARFSTDIIASVAFGLESNSLKNPESIFRLISKKVFIPSVLNVAVENLVPYELLATAKFQRYPSEVRKYFTSIVKNVIAQREETKTARKDFIQLMIEEKNRIANSGFIDDMEIINESFAFFIAGFETSSSTMTFALLELAQNPQIQDKLRNEIQTILEKHDNQVTYDSIQEIEYLERVVLETLRKYPIAVTLRRKCTENYTIPGTDIIIEKGTLVHIPVIGLHMDPEFYENPEEFNPDNFSPEKIKNRSHYSYLAFGEGPRLCIGLRFGKIQTKVGLVSLLKNFEFRLHESTKPPFEADCGSRNYVLKQDVLLVASRINSTH